MKYKIYFKSGNTAEISEEMFKSVIKSYEKIAGQINYTKAVEVWDDLMVDLYEIEAIIPLRAEQREKLLTEDKESV